MAVLDARFERCWLSAVGAITGLVKFLGSNVDDTWVAGLSGFAFRNCVEDEVLPGSLNSNFIWFDTFQSSFDRLGFVVEIIFSNNNQLLFDSYGDYFWEKIVSSIDNNLPVLVWESFEFGLVKGIDKQAQTWLCDGVSGIVTRQKIQLGKGDVPVMFGVFPIKQINVDKIEAVKMALRTIVGIGFLSKPPYPSERHPVLGVEAYKKWIDEFSKSFNVFGNAYLIQVLTEARREASLFLAKAAELFSGVPSNMLLRASERFAQVFTKLKMIRDDFPFPGSKNDLLDKTKIDMAIKTLNDCYIMETEGFKYILTAVESMDLKGIND